LDVSKGTSDKIGIKYGQTPFKFTGGQRSSFFPFDEDLIGRKATNLDEDNPLIKWTRVDTGYDFSGMTAALEFLRGQSSSRTLARPRLLTLNNQTASIQISTNEAIGLNTVSSSTTTTSSQTVAQAERVQTGVALEVTPQANLETGEIILAVAPKVTEAKQGGTFGGQSFKDPEERSSKSILKVKNGETIMIGGLLRTANTESVSKLPILGDMPLIGAAFRHKSKDTSERELIIFITPYIIDEKYRSQLNNPSSVRLDREVKQPQHMDTINRQLDSLEMGY
jgi:type II secretory pathway component GspD/PulD (secretin)